MIYNPCVNQDLQQTIAGTTRHSLAKLKEKIELFETFQGGAKRTVKEVVRKLSLDYDICHT